MTEYAPHDPTSTADREILVAISHERLVSQELHHLLEPAGRDSSHDLGLVRLRLRDLGASVAEMRRGVEELENELDRSSDLAWDDEDRTPLDHVLAAVRWRVGVRYGGWQPVVGKNRIVELHVADGRLHYGGAGAPKAVQPESWSDRATGPGAGARVGVLDTALSPEPWLAGAWNARYTDLLFGAAPTPASAGHATFVTGLVLSQAPGSSVEVRGLLGTDGTADSWSAARGIVEIGRTGIDVLNLSFVCFTDDGQPPMAISTAIDRLPPDIVVVAAAGNHGAEEADDAHRPAWPAALDDVVAVGAAESAHRLAPFTPVAPWVDVVAPGVDLVSTYLSRDVSGLDPSGANRPYHGFAQWSGSSFATALVSGQIAAGIQPGRISARESWENIRGSLTGDDGRPSFLPLRTPTA